MQRKKPRQVRSPALALGASVAETRRGDMLCTDAASFSPVAPPGCQIPNGAVLT
jgi:hypothetical protein